MYTNNDVNKILLNMWILMSITLMFLTVLLVPINHARRGYIVFLSDCPAVLYTALEESG
jgi:hypothetical protein